MHGMQPQAQQRNPPVTPFFLQKPSSAGVGAPAPSYATCDRTAWGRPVNASGQRSDPGLFRQRKPFRASVQRSVPRVLQRRGACIIAQAGVTHTQPAGCARGTQRKTLQQGCPLPPLPLLTLALGPRTRSALLLCRAASSCTMTASRRGVPSTAQRGSVHKVRWLRGKAWSQQERAAGASIPLQAPLELERLHWLGTWARSSTWHTVGSAGRVAHRTTAPGKAGLAGCINQPAARQCLGAHPSRRRGPGEGGPAAQARGPCRAARCVCMVGAHCIYQKTARSAALGPNH